MNSISIDAKTIDDHDFVRIASKFVSHYVDIGQPVRAYIVHVDNWFGERWLGFRGKILGAAGVRNRHVNDCTLPAPPFKPSRIESAHELHRQSNGHYNVVSDSMEGLHANKTGDSFWYLTRSGIYCWYSGNTIHNTNGSMIIYEVTPDGSSGWYIGFDRNPTWKPTTATNVSLEECNAIMNEAKCDSAT